MIRRVSLALARYEAMLLALGAVCLFSMMVLVFVDVTMRYLFNSPLGFSYDLISLYLMVGFFFFSLSDTLRHDEHVRVDILYLRFRPATRALADRVSYGASGLFFAARLWTGLVRAIDSTAKGEVMATVVPWPVWVAYWIVPLGTAPIVLLCLLRFIRPPQED
jgi:TRAP-type C4-dicarboxylate transport system permease small subunit